MTKRSIKKKLLRARIALHQTIQKILEINRNRKRLSFYPDPREQGEHLSEELKVLNKTAEQQAQLVRLYEMHLSTVPVNSSPVTR